MASANPGCTRSLGKIESGSRYAGIYKLHLCKSTKNGLCSPDSRPRTPYAELCFPPISLPIVLPETIRSGTRRALLSALPSSTLTDRKTSNNRGDAFERHRWFQCNVTTVGCDDDTFPSWFGCNLGWGRSNLVIMNRDEDSEHQGYSAVSYLEVLKGQLPTIFSPGMIFMQDNACIHTAQVLKEWLEGNAIPVLEWPPYSPDLNPIEIVWIWLKEWVCEISDI